MASFFVSRSAWWLMFLGALLPLTYIIWAAVAGDLGAEPAKAMVEFLGETALMFLFATLSLTPLRKIKVFKSVVRYRRMLGLYVFFYATMHLSAYGVLLVDWQNFIEDIYKRLYVTMGFLAFVILLALAVTSPKSMVKRLGRKWKSLHRMVYVAILFVTIHVWWQVRSDYGEAVLYSVVVVVLFLLRYRYFKSLFSRSKS